MTSFTRRVLSDGAVDKAWTLTLEVPGSNPLAKTVVPLVKALYSYCRVLRSGLKDLGSIVACSR